MSSAVSQPLAGKVALVAGGTGTIGRAISVALARAGAQVIVHGRGRTPATGPDVLGQPHLSVCADLVTEAGREALATVVDGVGGADILVNAVHERTEPTPTAELGTSGLESHLDAVRVHAGLIKLVVPGMRSRRWGRIVYVAGATMRRPLAGKGAYAAAKAAATILTRYVAFEEREFGITANVVAPGRVIDPNRSGAAGSRTVPDAAELLDAAASGDFPSPDDVAAAVHSLVVLGDAGVTGQTLWVSGHEVIG